MKKDTRDIGHAQLVAFIEEIARYHIDLEDLPINGHGDECEACVRGRPEYYDAGGNDAEHDLLAHIITSARELLA